MPTSSIDQSLIEPLSDLQIIRNQIETMDGHVLDLHALLDLLDRPDDQKESLGEMLRNLLQNLTDRQAQYQVELTLLTEQMSRVDEQNKKAFQTIQESQRLQELKVDRLLKILKVPLA